MDWIQQWQSKLNKQNGVAPLVRTGGSRHTGLAALPYRNIHPLKNIFYKILRGQGKYAILSVREKARQMRNKKPHILRDGGENALFGEGSAETDYTADH